MDQNSFNQRLFQFLQQSPTSFHAVRYCRKILEEAGVRELPEHSDWQITVPGKYFVQRNGSSLILFNLASDDLQGSGLRMAGAHTDSPALKIKPRPDVVRHGLRQLGVEVYGGALLEPWFDRDLSIAGRVTWKDTNNKLHNTLLDFRRPVAVIPSLAAHLSRKGSEKKEVNKQTDLVPIIMQADNDDAEDFNRVLRRQLALEHDIQDAELLGHELFLYDSQAPSILGMNEEFITGGRFDNLLSCFALLQSFLRTEQLQNTLLVLNDHEEIGSQSSSGASGPFLLDVLSRILPDGKSRQRCINRSLFVSADNAHGVHPNFADRYDDNHLPRLNKGPVIKYNANLRYATSGRTAAFFKILAARSEIPVQEFVMRSDLACGSTIGPITAGKLGIQTLDVGVPSLAMHSVRETAGTMDTWYLFLTLRTFFGLPAEDPLWQSLAE